MPTALRALGEEYLERTRVQRKTDQPFFIDKMPNNWAACRAHPPDPAQREDHRRAPPSARLLLLQLQAAFRPRPGLQLRPRRARAAIIATMCALMAHFDAVLPGRVHRVIYERLVDDPEAEVRACSTSSACPSSRPASLPRERARGAHRQLRAGPPPDQPRGPRPVAGLRALARPAESGARAGRSTPGRRCRPAVAIAPRQPSG